MASSDSRTTPDMTVLGVLLENHRRFLAFLERRVGTLQDAEEILQSAFAKAVEHEEKLVRDTVVAWFYRILRNTLIDHYRHQDIEQRAIEKHACEVPAEEYDSPELARTICECFRELLPTLTPQSRSILERVDLGDQTVGEAAQSLGITPNNAGVRLYRARQALKERLEQTCRTCAQHGCYDCTCGKC
jgi:RNA polymerase sigma factor (sigma-70 family)